MARHSGIVNSAKHIPGGARPTPAPQGSGPNIGQISPLAAQLDAGGSGQSWANAYGGFLPRPAADFTQGAFGPFSPILPVPVDAPPSDETPRAEPRLWQYDVGWNLPVGQPGSEGVKLADFSTLRTLADLYSIARACIQLRKAEIRGLEWDITPTRDAAKAMRGSHRQMKDFGARRAEAVKFFRRPDPNYFSWNTWLDAALEEVFVFDALSILLRPKWAKGQGRGLLGSDLDSLALIDGPTIRPLVDLQGATPRPPAPAYQQYLYGVPRTDLMTMITERDIEDAHLTGAELGAFRGDQLLYLPMVARPFTKYGFPPIERALIPVMAGLQKQGYQLDYFREGSIPGLFVSPGGVNANMTPNQIRELQDALNAIAGDPAWKHKIIVLPADSKVTPQRPVEIADQFDEIIANQVCMAFDVQPMELGIMPKVSSTVSPGASNQMAKATQGIHERKATKPTLQFLADIFNSILRDVCHQDDMQFVFEGLEEDEDEQTQTALLAQQINVGLRSIDEGREQLGLQPWGLPETSDPGWATATGFTPLGQVTPAGQVAAGPQPDAQNPAGGAASGQQQAKPTGSAPKPSAKPAGTPDSSDGNAGQTPGHAAAEAARGASKNARPAEVKAAAHQQRREHHLAATIGLVAKKLHGIIKKYKTGKFAFPTALDQGVEALGEGYRQAMDGATGHAADDHDDIDAIDYSGDAATQAENQRPYLAGLIKAVANDTVSSAQLGARLDTYTSTLRAAYNMAYGSSVLAAHPAYEIVWRLGSAEHCQLCTGRDGKVFTLDTLPGYPGDGGFGGPVCLGGPNCHCSVELRESGRIQDSGDNTQRPDSVGYYRQQLADITARRQAAQQEREDFLASIPTAPAARAHTRDSIRHELADLANQRIRSSGGYPGISVEPSDIPASQVAARTPAHMKAVDSELQALVRHVHKGRLISTWEPRHITQQMLARVAENMARGLMVDDAIEVAKATRRIEVNGQEVWVPQHDLAGGGGRVLPAHTVDGIEVPGGAPGPSAGGEPPRWAPPQGTSSGDTFSGPRPRARTAPDDADDGMWPQGGHGTAQPPTTGIPGSRIRKGAADLSDPNPVDATHVKNLMLDNFPAAALAWVDDARWIGPVQVPLDRIDWDDQDSWAASHQPKHVKRFAKRIRHGDGPHPAIGVQVPGEDNRIRLVDGHHRALAYKKLGKPVVAYIGFVPAGDDRWTETHSFQLHQGNEPANKVTDVLPVAAGIAVQAADTGRVLMLQRAICDADPAAGCWEFPGGCLEPGETLVVAAVREWQEETGCTLPAGQVTGHWQAGNGRYAGFVYTIQSEADVPIGDGRDQVINPDDPDGDSFEALAWWSPDQLAGNPAVRPELLADLHMVLEALGRPNSSKG